MAIPVAKNTVCLWFDGDAEQAARFYSETFPDSSVDAVHRAPGDFPSGKQGDVLTVHFTVLTIPCLGLNGGPTFKHSEAFSFQVATENPGGNRPLLERDHRWRWPGKRMRLVQGQVGTLVADHSHRPNPRLYRSRSRGRQTSLRRDDDDAKD